MTIELGSQSLQRGNGLTVAGHNRMRDLAALFCFLTEIRGAGHACSLGNQSCPTRRLQRKLIPPMGQIRKFVTDGKAF